MNTLFKYLMIDCTTAQIEVLRKYEITRWLATNHLSSREAGYIAANQAIPIEQAKEKSKLDYITQQYICIWAYICKTSQ